VLWRPFMVNNYFINVIRVIFIVVTSILSINIIIYSAIITNITGMFPTSFYSNINIQNVKTKILTLLVYIILIALAFVVSEYLIRNKYSINNTSTMSLTYVVFNILLSYIYIIDMSFFNFVVVLHFISNKYIYTVILNTFLNTIAIYLVYKFMLDKLQLKHLKLIFWLTTLVMSVLTVSPFGSMLLPLLLRHLL